MRTGREYCLQSERLHLSSSGLGTCCPPGAQTVIWLQNWGSAPHCGSLKVTRHLLSADIYAVTRNRGNRRWGRREAVLGTRLQESPLAATREPSRCHALESAHQTSECLRLWHLEDAWSEASSLCTLKQKRKCKEKKYYSFMISAPKPDSETEGRIH